ncbi:unnamed protein product, partial [marine sediment metagenome]
MADDTNCDGTGGTFCNGAMAHLGWWNRSISTTEMQEYMDNPGLPEAAEQGAPSAPTIESPSPTDSTAWNVNVTLNVSHTTGNNDVRYY